MSKLAKALTAAAGNAGGESLYVEDVFSTYLYTGTGAARTITNNIDLDGEGGLVWIKNRDNTAFHNLHDTERGVGTYLKSHTTDAEVTDSDEVTAFNSNGFSLGDGTKSNSVDGSDYASWTFRKAEKFFDVVTYTGTGTSQVIAHALNSTIGSVFIKRIDSSFDWKVYHISLGTSQELELNQTGAAASTGGTVTAVSDSSFTVGGGNGVNASGGTYVAYVFAHDAGGFGDDGSESIIKCGSYTGNGSTDGPEIDLGFEPQFLIVKNADASVSSGASCNWRMYDSMRGWEATGGEVARLFPNLTNAESSNGEAVLTATGFKIGSSTGSINGSGETFIYIAIRRPMKTPESGAEVFSPDFQDSSDPSFPTGFVVDAGLRLYRPGGGAYTSYMVSRLTGDNRITTTSTAAEESGGVSYEWDFNDGWGSFGSTTTNVVSHSFKRATGFFDVVAYEGTGSNTTNNVDHNLGVIPEMIIVKKRDGISSWPVYHADVGLSRSARLNRVDMDEFASNYWSSAPTSTQFYPYGSDTNNNGSWIAYLFATLDGVSKVGSYTGTGSNVDVDCGFSAGARFILIKRTSGAGDWYVYDSERGIVAGNDPYLLLNSTAAEVTNTDYIDPLSSGFTVTSSGGNELNDNGSTYIFLAIA